jgi:hypothetical protein
MTWLLVTLAALLAASISLSVYLSIRIKKISKAPAETYDARELLHDLTSPGFSMVEIRRVSPASIMIRSPRDIE